MDVLTNDSIRLVEFFEAKAMLHNSQFQNELYDTRQSECEMPRFHPARTLLCKISRPILSQLGGMTSSETFHVEDSRILC